MAWKLGKLELFPKSGCVVSPGRVALGFVKSHVGSVVSLSLCDHLEDKLSARVLVLLLIRELSWYR